ncbi:TPA: magnesium transporter [Candidatus Micrarchaeota archaeon]|nr:MAG: hypothetical protein AUJ65_02085 [Candidatus Micrarchaeota archaeon CG1_02_51_15]HII38649.1 magnesium transporter [Candidatus Micrarchaeota archaeon]
MIEEFKPRTAGARMTARFLAVPPGFTVRGLKDLLYEKAGEFETIDYVYVTDEGELVGVASLKEVFQAEDDMPIRQVMRGQVIEVGASAHQERAAYLALKHGLRAIPVVDCNRVLLGVIPHAALLEIFHQESAEDALKAIGIHHKPREIEDIKTTGLRLIKARLPSLLLGLVGGTLVAYLIGGFEIILKSYIALAAFLPVIVYLSDAVGTQSQTLVVRMIALEPEFSVRRYLWREAKVGLALGAACALAVFPVAWFIQGTVIFACVVSASLFISVILQSLVSTYASILLHDLHFDPGTVSGPVTTIISDLTTILIYFAIAVVLLKIV